MNIQRINWKRGDVEIVLEPDRKALVPLLRQTALDPISVGVSPVTAAFDGAFMWVTNSGSNTLSKIDVATNQVVGTVGAGPEPRGLAFDSAFLWVTSSMSATVRKIPAFANIR